MLPEVCKLWGARITPGYMAFRGRDPAGGGGAPWRLRDNRQVSDSRQLIQEASSVAEEIADAAQRQGLKVAVAESLTGGKISAYLGAASSSVGWFRGGVVAYADEVKYDVLGVRHGPLIDPECAIEMARGVADLLGADIAVAVSGVGGPERQEGHEVGTVYFGLCTRGSARAELQTFGGETDEILESAAVHALKMLRAAAE